MDFLPHTPDDDAAMLEAVRAARLEDLFAPIPAGVKLREPLRVPTALSEPELMAHLGALASENRGAHDLVCLAGGGAYDHYVPAVVRALALRSEFATSYTPYQPELSQGVLQALFEFQSMVCELYGMEVANASLYDGATALVEAVNLSVRVTRRPKVLVSAAVHPHYLEHLRAYSRGLGLAVETVPLDDSGVARWDQADAGASACTVCAYPNFFGRLEDVGAAAECARAAGALSIVVADPTAMGLLRPPGDAGADVVTGEGQAFGNPLGYGGPYVGLFATRLQHVRQVPGRIVGETVDADGRRAFVLTLQAREQHIRRSKATSNVCTNQTLMAIAAAVHLAWLGPAGLQRLGELCLQRTAYAARRLAEVPGCRIRFDGPRFKEFVLQVPGDAAHLCRGLARRGWLAGPPLGRWFPGLGDCLLVAVTERRTLDDVDGLAVAVEKELAEQ